MEGRKGGRKEGRMEGWIVEKQSKEHSQAAGVGDCSSVFWVLVIDHNFRHLTVQ